MKKLLILLVWLLGLALIAWLCGGLQTAMPPIAAVAIAPAAVTAPSIVAASPPRPAPAPAPVAVAAPVAPSAVQVATSRIDEVLQSKRVEFRPASAVLTSAGMATLAEIGPVLKANPSLNFEVQGHTDSTGNDGVNNALSQARADAVKAQLVKQQAVVADRITAIGHGSSMPVADNSTADGRARNRRIAFAIKENK